MVEWHQVLVPFFQRNNPCGFCLCDPGKKKRSFIMQNRVDTFSKIWVYKLFITFLLLISYVEILGLLTLKVKRFIQNQNKHDFESNICIKIVNEISNSYMYYTRVVRKFSAALNHPRLMRLLFIRPVITYCLQFLV